MFVQGRGKYHNYNNVYKRLLQTHGLYNNYIFTLCVIKYPIKSKYLNTNDRVTFKHLI